MKTLPLSVLALLLAATVFTKSAFADPWTSTEGKTIYADFHKFDGASVTLTANQKSLSIPLSRLDDESRIRAHAMRRHIARLIDEPVLSEPEACSVAAIPEANGRHYIVSGTVAKVTQPGGLAKHNPGDADIVLEGGTAARITFDAIDGRSTKAKFELNKVVLMKASTINSNGPGNFTPRGSLISAGDKVLINVKIEGGRVIGLDLAKGEVVTKGLDARLAYTPPSSGPPTPAAVADAPSPLKRAASESGTISTPSGNYQWNRNLDGSISVLGPPSTGLNPSETFTISSDLSGNVTVDP
jgi:hypothetical protein